MMKKFLYISFFFAFLLTSCEQSDPEFNNRNGDILQFAGRNWVIKHGSVLFGPGPNYFSNHPDDIWIDQDGYLHLTISERDEIWYATEVVSEDTMGYGTYVWTVQGDLKNLDPSAVLGLFTWDNNTFQEEANSEVDIEFAKWGEADMDTTLQYGVQPIAFGPYNAERVNKPKISSDNWIGVSTHAFTWTDTLIYWESYLGDQFRNGPPAASWSFDLSNPPKIKYENGNQSNPVIIPAPGNTTNARMNLWLLTGPEGPSMARRQEVIIRDFKYFPLQ